MSSKVKQFRCILLFSVLTLYISHLLSSIYVMAHDRQSVVKSLARLKRPWKSREPFLFQRRVSLFVAYSKFGFAAPMYNVCTLRYYQKRELCKTILSLDLFNLQFVAENSRENPDLSCKSIYVDFSTVVKGSTYERVAVSAYKCPYAYKLDITIRSDHIDHKKIFIPIRLFISGSIYKNSAVLYYQHVSPLRTKIKAYLVAFKLPVISLSFMVLEQRNKGWENSIEHWKPFHERNVERLVGLNGDGIRDPWEAESALARSEEIKLLPLMARFEQTFKLKNICGLKREEKVRHCIWAFQNVLYSTLINRSGRFICRRRKAVFNFFYSLYSKSVPIISSLHCPTWKWTTSYSFYLSTHLRKPSSIAFIRINPFPELLPDAVAHNYYKHEESGSHSDENI